MPRKPLHLSSVLIAILFFSGCSALFISQHDKLFGKPTPKENIVSAKPAALDYNRDIQPILSSRCVVCHACYDAPCQLKLGSYEGVLRGATTQKVYDATRLTEADTTRLFQDAHSTAQWRERDFFPVLNERKNEPTANIEASLLAQSLQLKALHKLNSDNELDNAFDFSIDREQQCPTIEDYQSFAQENPLHGMPFGLPAIPDDEFATLNEWLANGAPNAVLEQLDKNTLDVIDQWESWLNGDSLKQQLVSRYLYEHLYLANLYFSDLYTNDQRPVFLKLVRSSTPPGEAIQRISTRRPYDDPSVDRVYYRFWRDPSIVVKKTHLPYALNDHRMALWQEWFIDPDYKVAELPPYDKENAPNPFAIFHKIPVQARHQFLLSEAQFTVMNFIRGPVCRGQTAVNVIRDQFWVLFSKPGLLAHDGYNDFLASQKEHLQMPAESSGSVLAIAQWTKYANAQSQYVQAKAQFLKDNISTLERGSINLLWDGDQDNKNAALTVFRHFDNATVIKGLAGKAPRTVWLIDYPILERIHYLLVAGFDVYGSVSHQLMTRMYMDFLRMESEMNFLAFLPQLEREKLIANWYRGAQDEVKNYVDAYFDNDPIQPLYEFHSKDYKSELLTAVKDYLKPVLDDKFSINHSNLDETSIAQLNKLNQLNGVSVSSVPEMTYIMIGDEAFTLTKNSAHANVASLFNEDDRRIKEEDTISLLYGVIGDHPNWILLVDEDNINEFVSEILSAKDGNQTIAWLKKYGLRRNNPSFWQLSDKLHAFDRHYAPLAAGVLDFNRYENY